MSSFNRTLGFPMLCFYGTGMILGAGIYSIIGKAAAHTGETLWIGFLLAGFAALLTALSYAELSTMYPKAGAEFIYLREAFNTKKWIASTAGIAMAFSGAATAATVALAFSGYFSQFFDVNGKGVAAIILVLFTGISIIGIKTSGWVTVISTLIEIGGLILIIYFGFTSEKFGEALSEMPTLGTLSGTALIIFSFFGFENIATLAEEAKDPKRDLPRAIILSVVISTILYVFVSLSALAIVVPEKLAQSTAPLMFVAQTASANAGKILGAIALFSTANTALISLIGASRILYSMGKEKALPSITAKVISGRKTPWISSIFVLITAGFLLSLGKLETIASVSSLATMLAFFAVNIALIVLRYTQRSKGRPFRVPLRIGLFPVLPLLGAILSFLLLTQFEEKAYLVGGTFLSTAAIIFFFLNRKK